MSDESMLELLVQGSTQRGGLREAIVRRAIELEARPSEVARGLLDALPLSSPYREEVQRFADMWRARDVRALISAAGGAR